MIVAGTVEDAVRDSGDWVFLDLGFSAKSRSCGIAVGDERPCQVSYGELGHRLLALTRRATRPVNLLIEAPLSVAFTKDKDGNPTGRQIEKRGGDTRYWYVGPGAAMMVAATYLVRQLSDSVPVNEVRLFEGFASFKGKGSRSSHVDDVCALRDVVWGRGSRGRIVGPDELRMSEDDDLRSAFAVAGMDFGIPAVVLVEGEA